MNSFSNSKMTTFLLLLLKKRWWWYYNDEDAAAAVDDHHDLISFSTSRRRSDYSRRLKNENNNSGNFGPRREIKTLIHLVWGGFSSSFLQMDEMIVSIGWNQVNLKMKMCTSVLVWVWENVCGKASGGERGEYEWMDSTSDPPSST